MDRDELEQWLLDSDPTLRWQVQRDLTGAPEEVWQATRASMAHEGDAARLLALQDADGQWAGGAYFPRGIRARDQASRGPVRGILAYEQLTGDDTLAKVRHRGEEYLLERRLRYRLSTGEPVGTWADLLMYPYRHPHTALKAVDYFTEAAAHDGVRPDLRIAETIDRVRDARQPDGRWLQGDKLEGAVWFPLDVEPGEPSKWVTFLALRALQRWDAAVSAGSAA
jgi:hypothetical protein